MRVFKCPSDRGDVNHLGIVENAFRSNESECLDGLIKTVVAVPLVTDGPPVGILMGLNKVGGNAR